MTMAKDESRSGAMARIVVKAWTDPDFAQRLKKNPMDVLEDEGIEFEKSGNEIVVHIDTPKTRHLVIPMPPALLSVGEDELLEIAAQRLSIQLELF